MLYLGGVMQCTGLNFVLAIDQSRHLAGEIQNMRYSKNNDSVDNSVDYSRSAAEYVSGWSDDDYLDELDFVLSINGSLKGTVASPDETCSDAAGFRWDAAKREYELMQRYCTACKTPVALDTKRHKFVGPSKKIKCMRSVRNRPAPDGPGS